MSYHSSLDQDTEYGEYLAAWEHANMYLTETDEGKFVSAMFSMVRLIQRQSKQEFYQNITQHIFDLATYASTFKKESDQ